MQMPAFKPRRIDEGFVDRWSGYRMRPILPHRLLPHDTRRDFDQRLTRRCGYCGEFVALKQWEAHKEYCWGAKWMRGAYKGGDKCLRITDRAWADGDRSIRR